MRFHTARADSWVDGMLNPHFPTRTIDFPNKEVSGQYNRTFDVLLSCQSPFISHNA